ncbi:MAG: right-handed parallel beta-helix repeat-containing protein, partial [Polyangiaceae bacterium]|nr:right-handed parallel beta-helix repeat-containing protein [Polyangiaceae bacterium]
QTEQGYWNEKRKRHMAGEHSAGIVTGLDVTATSPASLHVLVAPGRAVDAAGNDPEVEAVQDLDLTGLVPGSGQVTVYITLTFDEAEVEPYYVDELGAYQNKYLQDGVQLAALTAPPVDPAVELARVLLAAGATEITAAADPQNPVENEIDLTHRDYTGKEVLELADLSDVSPDQAAAFGAMAFPSAMNPIGTLDDIAASVNPVAAEVATARGARASLDERLDQALAENGALKSHGATHRGDGSDPIAMASPSIAGLMSAADKAKLDTVENGAVAAGAAGDAHAAIVTGNPHALDAADVGAAPASHVGAGGSAHALATTSVAGFVSAADKTKLNTVEAGAVAAGAAGDAHAAIVTGNPHALDAGDVGAAPSSHVGAGGGAHALAVASGDAGFMSGADKLKLDTLSPGSGGWTVLSPAGGSVVAQLAGHAAGQKFWLLPGTYAMGGVIELQAGAVVAGTRLAVVQMASTAEAFRLLNDGARLLGFTIQLGATGGAYIVQTSGSDCEIDGLALVAAAPANRAVAGIYLGGGARSVVRNCRIDGVASFAAVRAVSGLAGCVVENNHIDLGDVADSDYVVAVRGEATSSAPGLLVQGNVIELGTSDKRVAFTPAPGWRIVANRVIAGGGAYDGYGVLNSDVGMDQVLVANNTFEGGIRRAVHIEGAVTQWIVNGNSIKGGVGGCGVFLGGAGKTHIQIADNVVHFDGAADAGIDVFAETGSIAYLTIHGNHVACSSTGVCGIRLRNSGTNRVSDTSVSGDFVYGFQYGISAVFAGAGAATNTISINGNTVRWTSVAAISLGGESPYFLEHVNVNDNNVYDFADGIVVSDVRRGTIANNQLRTGTGIGVDLGLGSGTYDVKVLACDVEASGSYCYRVGHQRNTLLNCSGRGATIAVFYVFGSHNHVVACETHNIGGSVDILRVEGNRHSISGCDFAYGAGGYAINLMSTSSYCFVHDNRIGSADGYNGGTANTIINNLVGDTFKGTGF